MKFVSFHTHTTYSYADGFGTVKEHVQRVKSLGMSALALSEHGNVNSHAALEREAKQAGIKPIFGVEAYFGPVGEKRTKSKYHITLFAQNEKGYHNLNKLVTQSYIDAHQWPTVSPQALRKYSDGIIAFSGCSDSLVSCSLLGGKLLGDKRESFTDTQYRNTRRKIEWFLDVFGPERFFLEAQRFPKLARTCTLNPAFAQLSRDTGVSLVATADVHYPFPHQNEMQKVLHAHRRSGSVALNEQEWEYDVLLTYPESDEEIINDLQYTGLSESESLSAVQCTARIAESCNVELPKAKPLRFKLSPKPSVIACGPSITDKDRDAIHQFRAVLELKKQIREGWKKRKSQRPDLDGRTKEYSTRINHEFKVIADKDFCDYFLVIAELVQWAKNNDITVAPGRGSAAGSVICYLLGITEIDPLHPTFQRMIFERFIDPNRSDMPDIDIDIDDERRHEIVKHAKEVYGNQNVCNIANHTKYRAKAALKGAATAYGLSPKAFEYLAKRCIDRNETDDIRDDSIRDAIEAYKNDPVIEGFLQNHFNKLAQAAQLEGNEHSLGIHAGGFAISSEPIPDVCPIYIKETGQGRAKRKVQVIPYDKRDAEHVGFIKVDLLGLITMGVLGKIRGWINMPLSNLYNLYYQDFAEGGVIHNQIMSKFLEDDLVGIFQYEGGTTRDVTKRVRPTTFDELAACVALSRPGPMYGKDADGHSQTDNYIAIKNGERDWRRIHPTGFDRHVEWTNGQIVYQEQIMWILRDLAGFSTERVLKVRKIIGKKLGEHQFAELWEEFRDGCARNGVGESDAASVWGGITTAAGYAFNTAHSYSYALVAWWSMYFKLYSVPQFFAASLAKNGDGADDISRRTALLQDAEGHGTKIAPLSLVQSNQNWEPLLHPKNTIVPGFMQIPDIAKATADDIVAWRGNDHEFMEWDFLALPEKKGGCSGIGPVTVEKIKSFVARDDPFGIHRTSRQLSAFREECKEGRYDEYGLPSSDEFYCSYNLPENNSYVAFVGLVANYVVRDEVESMRQRTGKSVEEIQAKLDSQGAPGQYKKATIFGYDEYGEVALRISRWRYEALQNRLGSIIKDHHIIVAYGKNYEGKGNAIQVNTFWLLNPD